jgi:hypothetical protein
VPPRRITTVKGGDHVQGSQCPTSRQAPDGGSRLRRSPQQMGQPVRHRPRRIAMSAACRTIHVRYFAITSSRGSARIALRRPQPRIGTLPSIKLPFAPIGWSGIACARPLGTIAAAILTFYVSRLAICEHNMRMTRIAARFALRSVRRR